MNISTTKQPGWLFSFLVYILVALVPAFWFYKQPAKLIAFLMIQMGIVVFWLVYPFVGAVYFISYLILIHSVRNKI